MQFTFFMLIKNHAILQYKHFIVKYSQAAVIT